jgi:hypothetical protein
VSTLFRKTLALLNLSTRPPLSSPIFRKHSSTRRRIWWGSSSIQMNLTFLRPKQSRTWWSLSGRPMAVNCILLAFTFTPYTWWQFVFITTWSMWIILETSSNNSCRLALLAPAQFIPLCTMWFRSTKREAFVIILADLATTLRSCSTLQAWLLYLASCLLGLSV